ncbi:MAG: TRIC cation channel family protein [Olegusella sp.]|nr:TRIC cation channel family protein [Olegusella sp.]
MGMFFSAYGSTTYAILPIPAWLDLAAVMVGAFSGILAAQQRKLDLVGYVGLALICGLGGGLIRDTILQSGDVYMMTSDYAIPGAVITGVFGFLFPNIVKSHPSLFEWVDIVSVALFVVAGTDKAIVNGARPLAAMLLGTITGVGGGMLRDVFLGEVPKIFQRSNLYALCALAGAACYYGLVCLLRMRKPWALLLCVIVIIAIRRWSLHYNVLSPADVDLGPHAAAGARAVSQAAQNRGRHEATQLLRQQGVADRLVSGDDAAQRHSNNAGTGPRRRT